MTPKQEWLEWHESINVGVRCHEENFQASVVYTRPYALISRIDSPDRHCIKDSFTSSFLSAVVDGQQSLGASAIMPVILLLSYHGLLFFTSCGTFLCVFWNFPCSVFDIRVSWYQRTHWTFSWFMYIFGFLKSDTAAIQPRNKTWSKNFVSFQAFWHQVEISILYITDLNEFCKQGMTFQTYCI